MSIPWLNNVFVMPEVWGGINITMDAQMANLQKFEFSCIHVEDNTITLSGKDQYWSSFCFGPNSIFGDAALMILIAKYPEEKTALLKIALNNSLTDVWNMQDDKTKALVMAEVLGSKNG